MGKRMYEVKEPKNSNAVHGTIRNNRDATAASLRNFRANVFHDKRENRGGSQNEFRDYLNEYALDEERE
jgi:hypothetical protein